MAKAKKRQKRKEQSIEPPTRGGTWALAVLPAAPEVDPSGCLDMLVVLDERGPRGVELGVRPLAPDAVAAGLRTAMFDPKIPTRRPHVPEELLVPSSALKLAVIAIATAEKIAVIVEPDALPLQLLGEGLEDDELLEHPIGAPETSLPALMDAAERFARQAPWLIVDDEVTFEIRDPHAAGTPRFAVVLGAAGESFGLVLYHRLEDIEAIRDAAEIGGPGSAFPCIALNLEPVRDAPLELIDAVEDAGYTEIAGLVPWFLAFDGDSGEELTDAEADALATAVLAVTAFIEEAGPDPTTLPRSGSVQVGARSVEVAVHVSEGWRSLEPLFDFDHVAFMDQIPLSLLAESTATGAPEVVADSRRRGGADLIAVVVKARKTDAVRGARTLEAVEHLTCDPLGDGTAGLIAHGAEGALGGLLEEDEAQLMTLAQIAASHLGGLLVVVAGGGTTRNPRALKANQLVAARLLPVSVTLEAWTDEYGESPFDPDERYVFEVSLDGVEPRIWRRFAIGTNDSFDGLHRAIQAAVGWDDAHLFEFFRGSARSPEILAAAVVDGAWWDDEPQPDAELVPLFAYFKDRRRRRCKYRYDFGDDWVLTVSMVGVERAEGRQRELLAGERAFPPEDSGGPWIYDHLVAVVADPDLDPDRAEWLGDWAPEDFDLRAAARDFDE